MWERFGKVQNYVEPFFGSGAVLLARPGFRPGQERAWVETVNDADGMLVNFWRALRVDPDGLAAACDLPVLELDLHAWHRRIVDGRAGFRERLQVDPDFFDVEIAGRWVWGVSATIGGEWGNRQSDFRACPVIGGSLLGEGVHGRTDTLLRLRALARRLRYTRVCCGDWARVTSNAVIYSPCTGMFLDPPYSQGSGGCASKPLYAADVLDAGVLDLPSQVATWCLANGDNPKLRIALCGYEGEHDHLEGAGWSVVAWKAHGGYARRSLLNDNANRERVWFSPHCLSAAQSTLF